MRVRILVFAAIVAIALALNLSRLSLSIGQTGEDTLRARLATASSALRAQLELLDARLSPRAVASVPELVEATRTDSGPPAARPDERALRAAASALPHEPDLLAVATPQGAILFRRGKPSTALDNIGQVPLARAALEGNPAPVFATFEGATYRVAAARVPGNAAAAVVGSFVDDRFAGQLKSQVDADVTVLQGGKIIASSLSSDERAQVVRWAAAPGPGYGVMRVVLPLVGTDLSGKLPQGTVRYAVRGALVPVEGGMQVALTVPASPYHAWLARYQAFYVAGLVLFVLFSIVWALLARQKPARSASPQGSLEPRRRPEEEEVSEPRRRAEEASESARPEEEVSGARWPAEEATGAREGGSLDPAWGAPAGAAAARDAPSAHGAEDAGRGAIAGGSLESPWGSEIAPGQPAAEEQGNGAQAEAPTLQTPALHATRLQDTLPGEEDQDPDEPHWRETFDRFKELKARLGEPSDRLSFEKFAAKLKKNRADLLARHNCKAVRFSVYEKEGKAAIKASAIR